MEYLIRSFVDDSKLKTIKLNPCLFNAPYRSDILARVVRWQLSNRHIGQNKTKTISEVSGTTKKPFKQKGTGKARQGSLRSSHFVGGGVIFGPVLRNRSHKLQKKVRLLGLRIAISLKFSSKSLFIVDDLFKDINYDTKFMHSRLSSKNISSALFITCTNNIHFEKSISNLININVINVNGVNVYDILKHNCLFLTKDSLNVLEDRLI